MKQTYFAQLQASASKHMRTALGYYAARIGNSVSKFRDNLSVPFLRVKNPRGLEDETDRLPRNVGKELPQFAAY